MVVPARRDDDSVTGSDLDGAVGFILEDEPDRPCAGDELAPDAIGNAVAGQNASGYRFLIPQRCCAYEVKTIRHLGRSIHSWFLSEGMVRSTAVESSYRNADGGRLAATSSPFPR